MSGPKPLPTETGELLKIIAEYVQSIDNTVRDLKAEISRLTQAVQNLEKSNNGKTPKPF